MKLNSLKYEVTDIMKPIKLKPVYKDYIWGGEKTPHLVWKEHHQTLLTMLEFGVKLTTAGIGLGFSAILISYPMNVIMALMLVISTIDIVMSIKLYRMVFHRNCIM